MAEPTMTERVTAELRRMLAGTPSDRDLTLALRFLAKWRSGLLGDALVQRSGSKVLTGPFAGMDYPLRASEGSRTARLLGSYEASLAPVIEAIISRAYPLVIDVGCAEGYYAVGFARRMPNTRVLARDASEHAQALCRKLSEINGVQAQVEVGGLWGHADFDLCATNRAVVLCDIEGAEEELLDPAAAPGLRHADILVEVHEGMRPGLLARLEARFSPSHRITRLGRQLAGNSLPAWTEGLSDLDRLLLLWEWRASPTPWLWMERR